MDEAAYRIHVIYDVPGWAYHHRARALAERAPAGVSVTIGPSLPEPDDELGQLDLVLLLDFFRAELIARRLAGLEVELVIGVNVGWPDWEQHVLAIRENADALLFNNRDYAQRFVERHGSDPRCHQISNGIDTSLFRPCCPVEARPARALWLGSEVAAENKGYGVLRGMRPQIEALGLDLELRLVDSERATATLAEMADWYHTGQILIVASRSEGTPNPALEAAACGTVVVATQVGNIPELIVDGVNGIIIERSPGSILAGIRRARDQLAQLSSAMIDTIAGWSWDRRAPLFFELFTSRIDARRATRG